MLPPALVSDDGTENVVLAAPGEVAERGAQGLLSEDVRRRMAPMWRRLHDLGLMGDRKFANLTKDELADVELGSLIARQVSVRGQVAKMLRLLVASRMPGTSLVAVSPSVISGVRRAVGLIECPWATDAPRAHEALLAGTVGRFLLTRHEGLLSDPVSSAGLARAIVASRSKRSPEDALGFVVESFMTSGRPGVEGLDDAWDAAAEAARLARVADVRQMRVTRMPFETTGALWAATVYPHWDTRRMVPRKQGLDPATYGGYSRVAAAYFFVCELRDSRGRARHVLYPLPVADAPKVASGALSLEDVARPLAAADGCELVRVVRRRVLKYQLVEVAGERLYVTGSRELRAAWPLVPNQADSAALAAIKRSDEAAGLAVFERLASRLARTSPLLSRALGLPGLASRLSAVEPDVRVRVVSGVLAVVAARSNAVDLTAAGGHRNDGRISVTWSRLFAMPGGVTFIDQSPTGLREARQTIGG